MKNETKKFAVQSYETGLIEDQFETYIEAIQKCNDLNGKYSNGRDDQKEYRTVFIVDGEICDSERDYINN